MLPASAENRLQFVPNWNGITMPDTTPMPKATEKILIQNAEIRNSTSRPVTRCAPSITAMKEASPMVNAGSRMCQPITQKNCRRERISGSSVIGALRQLYADAACMAERVHSSPAPLLMLGGEPDQRYGWSWNARIGIAGRVVHSITRCGEVPANAAG